MEGLGSGRPVWKLSQAILHVPKGPKKADSELLCREEDRPSGEPNLPQDREQSRAQPWPVGVRHENIFRE